MNLFCTFRLIVIALFVFIAAGCGGGGGDGESGRPLESPEYDLTGHWRAVAPVSCTVISLDLFPAEITELELILETELLDGLGSRVTQMGNDLEIISLASGVRADATISGDQIRYAYSEQRMLGEFDVDVFGEAEGTVLNANRIAVTEDATLTLEARGEMFTVGILCTYHSARMG